MVSIIRRRPGSRAGRPLAFELQLDQLQQSAGKLQSQAQQALATGHEDLAREALGRRSAVLSQVPGLEGQQASLQAEEEKLTAVVLTGWSGPS